MREGGDGGSGVILVVIIGELVHGGGVVIGDVACERVVSPSLLLVMWYVGGGIIVSDVACEREVVASSSFM